MRSETPSRRLRVCARSHAGDFSPQEQVKLTLLIGAINVWNRIAVGFRSVHPT